MAFLLLRCIILISVIIITVNSMKTRDPLRNEFIINYFKEKGYMITMNICWNYDEIQSFLKVFMNEVDNTLIAIHRNTSDSQNFMRYLSTNNYFVLDFESMECVSSWNILEFVNATLEFRFPLKFLLFTNEFIRIENLDAVLNTYSILPSTDLLIAQKLNDGAGFKLLQPYKVVMEQPIIWENIGEWTQSTGLITVKTNMQSRRHDFRGASLKVVYYIEFNETWDHLEDFRQPRIDTFTKQNYLTIKAMLEFCNITSIMVPVKIWGYFNETTQTWSGLINKVANKEAVIAGSSPYFTAARFTVVDFIKMQNHIDIRFIMKKPPLSYIYNVYTLPFQSNVWKAMVVVAALFFGALYLILNWETTKIQKINSQPKFSPSDVSLIMCEAVCQQGTTTESRTITGRILEFIMFLGFFFLYSSYSAYIVVVLQSTYTIADYQELYDSAMSAGGMETSYMRIYLAGSKNKLQQKIYAKKIGPKGFYSLEDGIDRVRAGFFAFHAEVSASYNYIAKTFTDYDVCNLQIMEGFNSYLKGYTSVPKNSPYKEIFKVALMKLDEYGIQSRNYKRYSQEPKCHAGGGSFQSVGIRDMYNALLILAAGLVIAIVIMLCEILFNQRRMRALRENLQRFQRRDLGREAHLSHAGAVKITRR